jgi:hypothetical protein
MTPPRRRPDGAIDTDPYIVRARALRGAAVAAALRRLLRQLVPGGRAAARARSPSSAPDRSPAAARGGVHD